MKVETHDPSSDPKEFPFSIWIHFETYSALVYRVKTFEDAFHAALNIPGTQDFYMSSIHEGKEVHRKYPKSDTRRNMGWTWRDHCDGKIV
jgi:hypothetical protein